MGAAALIKAGKILCLVIYAAYICAQYAVGLCRKAVITDLQLKNQALRQQGRNIRTEMEAEIALTVEKIRAIVTLLFSDSMGMLRDYNVRATVRNRLRIASLLQ